MTVGDATVGGMVICDSSKQAKALQEIFETNYGNEELQNMAAEPKLKLWEKKRKPIESVTRSEVILHDVEIREFRKDLVEEFKEGKIDILLFITCR